MKFIFNRYAQEVLSIILLVSKENLGGQDLLSLFTYENARIQFPRLQ